jgi:L-Ala-D/L-Glu epimerase
VGRWRVTLRLETRAFRLPLKAPVLTAHGARLAVEGVLLRLRDGEGGVGLGEVTPMPDFGTETFAEAQEALLTLRLGAVPASVDAVPQSFTVRPEAVAARAGVEMALLDLVARRRGVALGRLLGAPAVRRVPVNALLAGNSPDASAEEAREAVALGFRTLKLKVGGSSPEGDVARLQAVREAVGSAVRLRVDANGSWSEAEARLRLPGLVACGLEYAEQPVAAANTDALRRLRAVVPVAADEALGLRGAVEALLDAPEGPAADVLVIKLPVLGGVLPALQLASRAAKRGVAVVVTSALDGAVGRAAAAHLALALGGQRAHGLATGRLLVEDPGAHCLLEGALVLQDVPGLGVAPEALGW